MEGLLSPDVPFAQAFEPLSVAWRGDEVESVHFGAFAVSRTDGTCIASLGDPGLVAFPRSSLKPIQLLALVASGTAERFDFTDRELAVMAGSHNAEESHLGTVRSILAKSGSRLEDLQCGTHPPYDPTTRARLQSRGEEPNALHNNCSGKHAGMVAFARHLGADPAAYLAPGHPVQEAIRETILAATGLHESELHMATDGCSAPNWAMPLEAMARGFARLLEPAALPERLREPATRVARAIAAHPEMIGGSGRFDTLLSRAAGPGLLTKVGAEGYHAAAFAIDGRAHGLALKVSDGADRARPPAVLAVLEALGVLSERAREALKEERVRVLRNHRSMEVGRVESVLRLRRTGA